MFFFEKKGNADCALELARLHLARGDLDACELVCASLARSNANNDEAAMLSADTLFLRQEYELATTKFRRLLEQTPNNYAALAKLIKLLRRAGQLADVPRFLKLAERSNARALSSYHRVRVLFLFLFIYYFYFSS